MNTFLRHPSPDEALDFTETAEIIDLIFMEKNFDKNNQMTLLLHLLGYILASFNKNEDDEAFEMCTRALQIIRDNVRLEEAPKE